MFEHNEPCPGFDDLLVGSKKPLKGFSYVEGVGDGIAQCAASPWTYRTDTGDEHGKVVESAELPEEGRPLLVTMTDEDNQSSYCVTTISWRSDEHRDFYRKYLIAWAVIQGGK